MRRPVVVLVIAIFIAAFAGPVAAQEEEFVNPLDVLIDAFDTPEGIEFVARFTRAPTIGASTNPDPTGDFEHSTGEEPGFTPDHVDITDTWSLDFDAGPLKDELFGPTDQNGFWAPTGPFEVEPPNYEPFRTFTGEEIQDGAQYEDGALLFGFTLADTPIPPLPGRCEYVVWINDLSRGPTFINHPSFPGDPAGGTNIAFGLGINPEGQGVSSTFTLEYQEGSGFTQNPSTDVRSFITPNYVGITVPASQLGEMSAINFYTFCMEEGSTTFDPAMSGGDQTGLIDLTMDDLGQLAVEEQVVVVATTTTFVDTTTTLIERDVGQTAEEEAASAGEGSGFPWWFVLIAGGLGLAITGWFLFVGKTDPCKKLLDAWLAASKKCDEVQLVADDAADDCEEAELELGDVEQERKDLCRAWPPACWKAKEDNWMEDDRGNRITSRDVHMRKVALGEVWDDYKAGKMTAKELEAQWQRMDTPEFREEMTEMDGDYKDLLEEIDSDIEQTKQDLDDLCHEAAQAQEKADEACTAAEAARLAYEECVAAESEAVTAAEAADAATSATGGTEDVSGPGVVAGTVAGTGRDPCDGVDPRRKYQSVGQPERISIDVDFSVITGVSSGSERNIAGGEHLIFTLNDLARDLDFAGDMLSARSAGLHVGGAINGYAQGKYVATAAGVVKGGIEATMATTDLVPDVPTSPASAVTEVLEGVANLGAFVARKVTEWMGKNQIMTVRLTMFYQDITATPYHILECREGTGWVCVEKVWEIKIGQLKRRQGRERFYTVGYERQKREFQNAVRGMSNRGASNIKNAAKRLIDWRSLHEPGACDQ